MSVIKLINIIRMIGKFCAVGAFVIGILYLAEYFGEPTKIELSEPFCWLGYSAVFAVFARVMKIAREEITNNINSTERV